MKKLIFLVILFSSFFSGLSYSYNGFEYELEGQVYVARTESDYFFVLKVRQSYDVQALSAMISEGRIRYFTTSSDVQLVSVRGDMVEIRFPGHTTTYWTEKRFLKSVPKDEVRN